MAVVVGEERHRFLPRLGHGDAVGSGAAAQRRSGVTITVPAKGTVSPPLVAAAERTWLCWWHQVRIPVGRRDPSDGEVVVRPDGDLPGPHLGGMAAC
ncbi:hypothetical protein [Frankia gtarii]|uniref:hypothetical protein n=1 Tax=Frankia gtarii TaxID=2950102 RepID=UPI0021C156D5|nr:hypothetical protein [Frankia gtarii]